MPGDCEHGFVSTIIFRHPVYNSYIEVPVSLSNAVLRYPGGGLQKCPALANYEPIVFNDKTSIDFNGTRVRMVRSSFEEPAS